MADTERSIHFAKGFQPPDEPGDAQPVKAFGEPSVVSDQDYTRISVTGEAERRQALLDTVTVDDLGIAHNTSPSGVRSRLVAVRVNDAKHASVVPFELAESPEGGKVVQLALPAGIPSRVGFFLGWSHSIDDVSAVIRAGFYPGTPLITQGMGEGEPEKEILLGLRGIKGTEEQDRAWAEQVKLFSELGFDPGRTRGFFDKASRPNASTTSWELQPLLMVPREYETEFAHFDRQRVEGSALQVMYYSETPVQAPSYPDVSAYRGGFGGDSLTYGGMRSFGGEATKGGDLGLAFGRSRLQTGTTTGIEIKGIEGAFRVAAVPRGK